MGRQENEMEESRNSYMKKFLMDKRTRCIWRGVGILRYYLMAWSLLLNVAKVNVKRQYIQHDTQNKKQ